MIRVLKRITPHRSFSQTTPLKSPKNILDYVKQYRQDKSIIHSRTFQALERVFEFQQTVEFKMQELTFTQQAFSQKQGTVNLALLKQYFDIRKEIGFNENIIAHVLSLIVLQNDRGVDHVSIGNDLFGKFLRNSPLFGYLIDDIKLLTNDSVEVDLDSLKSIINSLAKLEFKDQHLIELITEKLLKLSIIANPTLVNNDNLVAPEYLRPSIGNYNNILSGETLQKALKSILDIKQNPGNVKQAAQTIRKFSLENENDMDKILSQLETLMKSFAVLNIDFFHTIDSIREYYFDLKTPEKIKFMQANPDLYLDFLRLESKLVLCGYLMPKHLIGDSSENLEETKMVVDNFLFQQKIDPVFVEQLLTINAKLENKEQIESKFNRLKNTGQVKYEIVYSSLLDCFDELFNLATNKFPAVDSSENYRFESFAKAFGEGSNSFKDTCVKLLGENNKDLLDLNAMTNKQNVVMGHFGYTLTYQYLCTKFNEFMQIVQIVSPANTLKLPQFSFQLLVQAYVISRKSGNSIQSEQLQELISQHCKNYQKITPQILKIIQNNLEQISDSVFREILKSSFISEDILFEFIDQEMSETNKTLGDQISLLFFGLVCTRVAKGISFKTKLLKLLKGVLTQKTLEDIYNSRLKLEIPLPTSYIKFYFVVDFASTNIDQQDIKLRHLFDKALVRITSYLNIDWENKLTEDPAYRMIFESLVSTSIKHNNVLSQTFVGMNIILPLFPVLILNGHDKIVFLLKSEQYENSIMTKFQGNYFKLLIKATKLSFVNVSHFFATKDFQKQLNFDLRTDLDHFISGLIKSDNYADKRPVDWLNRFVECFDANKEDSAEYKEFVSNALILLTRVQLKLSPTVRTMNQKLLKTNLQHLTFWVSAFEQHMTDHFTHKSIQPFRTLKNDIRGEMELYISKILPSESDISLKNKHFGLEPYSDAHNNSLNFVYDFLNLKAFSRSSYFLVSSWKKELEPTFGTVQFFESGLTFFNKFSQLKKVILPNVLNRKLSKPTFQLFWEQIVRPSSLQARNNSLKYELLANHNQHSIPTDSQKWQISLLNFGYEFRAQENLPEILQQLCQLDFWGKLAVIMTQTDQHLPDNTQNQNKLEFDLSEFAYFFDPRISQQREIGNYKSAMQPKTKLRTDIISLKSKIEQEIPELFKVANSDASRKRLFDEYHSLKQDYLELLKEYQHTIDPTDSVFQDQEFKDLVYKIESASHDQPQINHSTPDNAFFDTQDHLRAFVENFLMDFVACYKLSLNLSLTDSEKQLQTKLKTGTISFFKIGYPKTPLLEFVKLEDVFSETDFKFLSDNFPSAQFQLFKNQSISDFLCILSIFFDHNQIAKLRNEQIIKTHLSKSKNTDSDVLAPALIASLEIFPKNSLRFYQNYLERKKWQSSLIITDEDLTIFKEMLSILQR